MVAVAGRGELMKTAFIRMPPSMVNVGPDLFAGPIGFVMKLGRMKIGPAKNMQSRRLTHIDVVAQQHCGGLGVRQLDRPIGLTVSSIC